ncbi:mannose-1-phosphate guanylyltransferase/mannose-6-phosphate isomerase [Caballeronia sp. GaOx3]|uniref:mannose-1-phosphate guanylyltransferase/mannose-6-phosphate isomerase n=1 Tax=Caballeronia sp. GaOx3 TaxID=2921740 RepID=UPI002029454F|nr:mannose-1-phosphate guanylyltransferase/mannose-6-phosphate isomerase [Caballeronia sp. GaOx3]
MRIFPVVLCGGKGSRLWPMSRGNYAKQYLPLTGEQSLLQRTALRVARIPDVMPPIVVTSNEQRFLVAEQLRQIDVTPSAIVLEPVSRNTAPATAVAAILARRECPDALLLVLPADHAIENEDAFVRAVSLATDAAAKNFLVAFGVTPSEPHSGYGYIRAGEVLPNGGSALSIEDFVEKPSVETARIFLEEGAYLWNSGMFMFGATRFLKELETLEPHVVTEAHRAVEKASRDNDFLRLDEASFSSCASISIDHAVMERTRYAAVIPSNDLGWNDIGSWTSLDDMANHDEHGNALAGDVVCESVSDCFIRANHRLVAAVGVENLIIVETPDAVLVTSRDKAQDVKKIVERLESANRAEARSHRRVYRPWGWYERIDHGDRFQVKRIVVNPGAQLSLQLHHHRAEHWIVVKGTAVVTNGDSKTIISENQSTFIPLGITHRLSNPGRIPLELIEVQSGTYLGEDDIVRLEDTYGRT